MRGKTVAALLACPTFLACLMGCTPEPSAAPSGQDAAISTERDDAKAGQDDSASGQADVPDCVGVWEPASVKTNGVVSTEADVLVNYDYRFALYEDGTAEVHLLGVDVRSGYELDGDKIVFSDAQVAFVDLMVDAEGSLVLTDSALGVSVTFARAE